MTTEQTDLWQRMAAAYNLDIYAPKLGFFANHHDTGNLRVEHINNAVRPSVSASHPTSEPQSSTLPEQALVHRQSSASKFHN